jgi:hypothetical protein
MQNPRRQNELRPTGRNDLTSRMVYQPRTTYRLETIIALQRALQNGIPETEGQQNENAAVCRAEPISEAEQPVSQKRFLPSLLTSIRHLVSAALQRRRACARVRNNVVGLP